MIQGNTLLEMASFYTHTHIAILALTIIRQNSLFACTNTRTSVTGLALLKLTLRSVIPEIKWLDLGSNPSVFMGRV
jgi:hypothetical protein